MRRGYIEFPKSAREHVMEFLQPLAGFGRIERESSYANVSCICVAVRSDEDFRDSPEIRKLIEAFGKDIPMDISQDPSAPGHSFSYGTMLCLRPGQAPCSFYTNVWSSIETVPLDSLVKVLKDPEKLKKAVEEQLCALPSTIYDAADFYDQAVKRELSTGTFVPNLLSLANKHIKDGRPMEDVLALLKKDVLRQTKEGLCSRNFAIHALSFVRQRLLENDKKHGQSSQR